MNGKIFFIAVFFGLVETAFFGWNFFPQSAAEVVCDGITMILFAMAYMQPRGA